MVEKTLVTVEGVRQIVYGLRGNVQATFNVDHQHNAEWYSVDVYDAFGSFITSYPCENHDLACGTVMPIALQYGIVPKAKTPELLARNHAKAIIDDQRALHGSETMRKIYHQGEAKRHQANASAAYAILKEMRAQFKRDYPSKRAQQSEEDRKALQALRKEEAEKVIAMAKKKRWAIIIDEKTGAITRKNNGELLFNPETITL